jgi:hypothetical protein
MRKLSLFAVVIALVLVGTATWIAATTQTWIAATTQMNIPSPVSARTDPMQLMRDARSLPTEQLVDYSLVFE